MRNMSLVLEGRPYYNFINSLHSEPTKKTYRYTLVRFMRFCQLLSVDKLLDLRTKDQCIIDYLLSQKGYQSKQLSLNAIKKFYEMNDIILNWKKISCYLGAKQKNKNRGYTHEEIQKVLAISDQRMKMIILLLSSSGVRVGALPELRIHHLTKLEGRIYKIVVYENSEEEYITFCTPECTNAIDSYLDYRVRSGEKITPDSPLIRKQFDINDLEQIRLKSEPITLGTLHRLIDNFLVKSGIRTVDHTSKSKRKEVPRAHGFRKFFSTQLVEADLKTEKRWLLEGHELKGNDSSYVRITEKKLMQEYEKAIDLLTIDPANRLRKKVEKLEVEKSQFDRLAAQLAALEQRIK